MVQRKIFAFCLVVPVVLLALGLMGWFFVARLVPDTRRVLAPLLFLRDDDTWVLEGGRQRKLIKNACPIGWSRDRRQILFVRGQDIWICSFDGSQQKRVAHNPILEYAGEITWHEKAGLIAFEKEDSYKVRRVGEEPAVVYMCDPQKYTISNIYVFLLRHTRVPAVPKNHTFLWIGNGSRGLPDFVMCTTGSPSFSPDGSRMAFSRNGDLWMAGVDDLEREYWFWSWDEERFASVARPDSGTYDTETVGVGHISWSPDGKWLAYDLRRLNGSGTEEIWVISASKPSLRRHIADGFNPTIDPTGKWVAYDGRCKSPTDMDLGIRCVSLDGKEDRLLVRHGGFPLW